MVRLFLSVDMTGSTQFKARYPEGGNWLDIFRTFFTNFPTMFAGQVGLAFLDEEHLPAIEVWKVMGDEVIFVVTPHRAEEVVGLLLALLRTINNYEARHLELLPLRLKGTAWMADFAEDNIEIEIPAMSEEQGIREMDFIGPDLDLGFRLSKFARPGCVTLSFDIADLVLTARNASEASLYLIGAEELRGVMFGRPYPIIWMLESEKDFSFLPWEIDSCPLMAKASSMPPSPRSDIERTIANMQLYLRKMHGVYRARMRLGGRDAAVDLKTGRPAQQHIH